MNRQKFIQELKSNIQLSEKRKASYYPKKSSKIFLEVEMYDGYGGICGLQQQISKQIRGYGDRIGLLEEIADAYICLRFLESIFDVKEEDLQKAIDVKLDRERSHL